ncbi:MAG: type II toxin-antitoxin system prevent-host-death family antitoxin [Armatimonadetes bacterium]|nr:type II toxin-antitoxin system prevent-host-death family antitoxin [Armatimonadota bacterium]
MKTHRAGIREAKAQLSRLLREVQRGHEWVITDRGRPIARLVPASEETLPLEERIRRLIDAGLVEPPPRDARDLPPPLPLRANLAQRWLQEDRNS